MAGGARARSWWIPAGILLLGLAVLGFGLLPKRIWAYVIVGGVLAGTAAGWAAVLFVRRGHRVDPVDLERMWQETTTEAHVIATMGVGSDRGADVFGVDPRGLDLPSVRAFPPLHAALQNLADSGHPEDRWVRVGLAGTVGTLRDGRAEERFPVTVTAEELARVAAAQHIGPGRV